MHINFKKYYLIPLIILIGIMFFLARHIIPVISSKNNISIFQSDGAKQKNSVASSSAVKINSIYIPVEIARDRAALTNGLSGRLSLDADKGLLFIFQKADTYRFWMPDMHFPIDIIWLNDDSVAYINENVSNNFNPVNPAFYYAPKPVRYVLEVNAGFAQSHNIKPGDKVRFNSVE